jgi:hypothetical protein
MSEQYPELSACEAAKCELDRFVRKHEGKRQAIIQLAKILEKHGWGGVTFEDEVRDSGGRQPIQGLLVSRQALAGDSVAAIVKEYGQLFDRWEAAFAAVPEAIQTSAARPHRIGAATTQHAGRGRGRG